ncbi:hypothetical protein SAMN05216553_109360 [Lentzea fradiae]|uniref:Uncharacterized protein n=1 Tax=Lentzea fradiae TaxID=200378 RepID=A0A1G7VP46_9PSEU|nr:hypothetical protein [Lentzea fradiae]SDG61595.1 hypothetical protein SAMN05216553_109360 [Lentzea fradiae]
MILRDYGSDAKQGDLVEFRLDGEERRRGIVMLLRSVGKKLLYVVQEELTHVRHEIPVQRIASVLKRRRPPGGFHTVR